MAHIDKIRPLYEAFGRGDIPAILGMLPDDVQWEYGVNSTDVPWLQPRRGRAGAQEFFQALSALDIQHFEVKHLLESGNVVVALVDLQATVRATGQRIGEEDEAHIWHFNDGGEIVRFRHRADTHQHWAAYKGRQ